MHEVINEEIVVPAVVISPEKVCFIVVKTREFDAKYVVTDPEDSSNPSDDGMISVLEDHDDDPVVQELTGFIGALTEDEQIDLVALTWLGRGDGGIKDWGSLRAEAARAHNNRTVSYLLSIPQLADFLEDGLAASVNRVKSSKWAACDHSASAGPKGAMLKDILVHLATDIEDDATINYAISVALAFEAHLAGAAFANDEVPAALLVTGVPPLWIDEYRQQSQDAAMSAVARFEAAAKRTGISAQAGWLPESLAGAANLFARMARRFDLSVVRRAEAGQSDLARFIMEAALFQTGRPVLVVPPAQKAGVRLDRVVIGWDGSASATRAIADAMPFLQRAKVIDLVMVVERGGGEKAAGADIFQHLARHRLAVEPREIVAPQVKPANVLLSHATESSADLLVLGGYGHSRLREFVLGGVTRSVLAATTIPALMSH